MSTEREGSHSLLCRESEFNLDIGRVGYGRRMHRLKLARSAQPQVMEVLWGWSDARERSAAPSQALIAFHPDRDQKSLS